MKVGRFGRRGAPRWTERSLAPREAAASSWHDTADIDLGSQHGPTTYIGRLPVFDRRLDVVGFHLLIDEYDGHLPSGPVGSTDRSRRLLTRALLEVGLDSLIGGRLGFVEIPVPLLAEGTHLALPPHRIIVEVPGTIDADGLDVLHQARKDGYRLVVGSLDDCDDPEAAARHTLGVRLDHRHTDFAADAEQVLAWNPRSQILADHLGGDADVETSRRAGAAWVRGDVLRPTEQIDEPTVPLHRVAVLELLAALEQPDVDVDEIDALVSTDVGMSYKLLRMANSSFLALERRVERTRDAIVYLGLDTVRAVAALLSLSEASDHPPEIVHLSLIRARHCEELLRRDSPLLAHAGFTTGMFSSLDVLLGLSVEQILHRIPVADHIADALRSREGRLGWALDVVLAYEAGDLVRLSQLKAEPAATVLSYRHALAWMNRIERGLDAPAQAS
ncbi:MAG: EAL and HDOD domain-containing protein [Acidimicrobiales bacterium]